MDEIARELKKIGHRVDVFTRRDDPSLPEIVDWAPGVRVIHVDAGPAKAISKDDIWPHMPRFRDELCRFVAREGTTYDVIHGNFWMSCWAALELREWCGAPVVQLFHALGVTKREHQGSADTSPADRIDVETRAAREADLVIAPCPNERDILIDEYGVPEERIVMAPLGVNLTRFRPIDRDAARRRIGVRRSGRLIVYVGRMLARKDVRTVIRALGMLRRRALRGAPGAELARLLVVGGDTAQPDPGRTPEIGVLQRLAEDEGVSDLVLFAGKRQPDDLHLYYGAADVCVTVPHYEPFGLTPLEAMACARPVVGAAVGGIAFTVRNGETGLLVPPKDPAALALAFTWLLSRPDARERMGRSGRLRVEREFRWDAVARRTSEIYDEAARRAASPYAVGV